MIVRSIDNNNDWNFGKGRNDYLQNNAAIVQNIKTRVQSFLGDCFFAIDEGIDWFNLLGAKNQLALELALRATVLNTDGVTAIVNFDVALSPVTRRISITGVVSTIFTGQTVLQSSVVGVSFLITEDGDTLVTESDDRLALG